MSCPLAARGRGAAPDHTRPDSLSARFVRRVVLSGSYLTIGFVFDRLDNYVSFLQTKLRYREEYEARRVGL